MIRLTDEQWERIRKHFPEEHIPDGRAGRKPIPTRLLSWRIEMSRVKQASQRSKAIPILGAAGLSLTLTSGVSAAAGPTPNTPARNVAVSQEITLREDEISDVSLATFHVFDNENQAGKRLACGCGGGCCLFARAPASPLGDEVYSTQPHRPAGRAHKHVPK
jgi:hypothetical protein